MFIPAEYARCEIHIDLLNLLVFLKAMDTKFTTDAAHLVSSPRSLVECRIVAVDPGNAGADFLDNADCTGCIGGKYPACQTVRSVDG